jgi:hypothetical protein
LPKELKLTGIATVEAANAFIREVYLPAHNARFAVEPAGNGSAFTPIPGVDLDEILCIQEERQIGNDNCVSYRTLKTADPGKGAGQGPRLSRRLARRLPRTKTHRPLRRERQAQGRWPCPTRRLTPLRGAPVGLWAPLPRFPPSRREKEPEEADK